MSPPWRTSGRSTACWSRSACERPRRCGRSAARRGTETSGSPKPWTTCPTATSCSTCRPAGSKSRSMAPRCRPARASGRHGRLSAFAAPSVHRRGNLLRVNPSMPYRDPRRPYVRWWFSAADAGDVHEFNELLRPQNQERLEAEGGVCIVATHFGKGFASDGRPHPETRRLLETLVTRNGWFPPVGDLLDWLRARRTDDRLPPDEWRRMQWRWARDTVARRLAARRRAHATTRRHASSGGVG